MMELWFLALLSEDVELCENSVGWLKLYKVFYEQLAEEEVMCEAHYAVNQ